MTLSCRVNAIEMRSEERFTIKKLQQHKQVYILLMKSSWQRRSLQFNCMTSWGSSDSNRAWSGEHEKYRRVHTGNRQTQNSSEYKALWFLNCSLYDYKRTTDKQAFTVSHARQFLDWRLSSEGKSCERADDDNDGSNRFSRQTYEVTCHKLLGLESSLYPRVRHFCRLVLLTNHDWLLLFLSDFLVRQDTLPSSNCQIGADWPRGECWFCSESEIVDEKDKILHSKATEQQGKGEQESRNNLIVITIFDREIQKANLTTNTQERMKM